MRNHESDVLEKEYDRDEQKYIDREALLRELEEKIESGKRHHCLDYLDDEKIKEYIVKGSRMYLFDLFLISWIPSEPLTGNIK